MEHTKPSLGEKYSELKVQEGTQERLEDTVILNEIVNDECFEPIKKQHLEQAQAMEERQLRATHAPKIFGIQEQIIEKCENTRRQEWELQVKERQA